jgi:hypothetical protein
MSPFHLKATTVGERVGSDKANRNIVSKSTRLLTRAALNAPPDCQSRN